MPWWRIFNACCHTLHGHGWWRLLDSVWAGTRHPVSKPDVMTVCSSLRSATRLFHLASLAKVGAYLVLLLAPFCSAAGVLLNIKGLSVPCSCGLLTPSRTFSGVAKVISPGLATGEPKPANPSGSIKAPRSNCRRTEDAGAVARAA